MKTESRFVLKNCAGIFTGEAFLKKKGRRIQDADSSFQKGPLDVCIDIDNKTITAIHKTKKEKLPSEEYDATGLWVTSAFYDSHTHALFSGTRAREYFQRWAGQSYLDISKKGGGIHNTMQATQSDIENNSLSFLNNFESRLSHMHRLGTSVVEIKTGYAPTPEGELMMLRFLKSFITNRPSKNRPEIKTTFLPLHALPKGQNEKNFLQSMLNILPIIKKEKLADFVDAFPEKGFFSLKSAVRLFEESLDLRIKVHADELSDMKATQTFCKMGALSVDHLQKVSTKGLKSLAESKTVATLLPATSFFSNIPYVNARRILKAGAQVALATDYNPGTAPELSMGFTQRLAASQLKMSATEIFCASTFNGAAAMGMSADSGVLLPGFKARICLWKTSSQNPSEVLEEIFVDALVPTAVCNPTPIF